MIDKAVILARGLGTRMRKADDGAELDATMPRVEHDVPPLQPATEISP